jgi:hypothetical protein
MRLPGPLTSCSSEDWEKPELRNYTHLHREILRYEMSLVSINNINIQIGAELESRTLMLW